MQVKDKIVVVTGAASGIGRALAQCFAEAGAKIVVCADIDFEGAVRTLPLGTCGSAGTFLSAELWIPERESDMV